MKQLHWKRKLKYLNAVAEHFVELGYKVERPTNDHDLLDVWGTLNGRECYQEIYVIAYNCHNGINGVWHQGEHGGVEVYLDTTFGYGLDTREAPEMLLDGLKPFKKGGLI